MEMTEYVGLYSGIYVYCILVMCQGKKMWKNTPGLKSHKKSSGVSSYLKNERERGKENVEGQRDG